MKKGKAIHFTADCRFLSDYIHWFVCIRYEEWSEVIVVNLCLATRLWLSKKMISLEFGTQQNYYNEDEINESLPQNVLP